MNEYAKLPTRGTVDSAGLDIYCPFNITVHADSQKRIPLGVARKAIHIAELAITTDNCIM